MTTVELIGLEFHGFHGVDEDERSEGQRFLYDVWLDVGGRGLGDRIEDAIDYRRVVECIAEVNLRQFQLLEALVNAVADALMTRFEPRGVRVRVRKPDVRLTAAVEHSAASTERP